MCKIMSVFYFVITTVTPLFIKYFEILHYITELEQIHCDARKCSWEIAFDYIIRPMWNLLEHINSVFQY